MKKARKPQNTSYGRNVFSRAHQFNAPYRRQPSRRVSLCHVGLSWDGSWSCRFVDWDRFISSRMACKKFSTHFPASPAVPQKVPGGGNPLASFQKPSCCCSTSPSPPLDLACDNSTTFGFLRCSWFLHGL